MSAVRLVRHFAKAISKDLIEKNIRVNSLLPGATETKLLDDVVKQLSAAVSVSEQELFNDKTENHPLKRIAKPSDIANVANYLCSEEAGFINGASIVVDGGGSVAMS